MSGWKLRVLLNRVGLLALDRSPVKGCRYYDPGFPLFDSLVRGLKTRLPWIPRVPEHQVEVTDSNGARLEALRKDVAKEIDERLRTGTEGRLFAVVHLCGKQFKVTNNDLIIVEGYWPPNIGDKLNLEKVLMVGSMDFTLIGRPVLNRELVSVDATVIEKTLSHTKTHFRFKQRQQYRRIHFYRTPRTTLRINSICIRGNPFERKEVEGLDRIY